MLKSLVWGSFEHVAHLKFALILPLTNSQMAQDIVFIQMIVVEWRFYL